ncbi:MAG: RloB domain-containing protein [Chitinophagia bacterium]|nr:RloB domain-containing protein [Chitinophagia bacterium]
MPKPVKFSYQKKMPFRDAFLCIIMCEGQTREPDYFRYFEDKSSRVKIVPVPNTDGQSSPDTLIKRALEKEVELDINQENDQVWFVVDTDKWTVHLHSLRREASERKHWQVAQSNPCFEVWLLFHVQREVPLPILDKPCGEWKQFLHNKLNGGFDSRKHPALIETAMKHARANYNDIGYSPAPGNTQLWRLAEVLLPLLRHTLGIVE